MILIRLEPTLDPVTNKFFLEIYHPHDAGAPLVTTRPRYQSKAAAESDIIAILAAAASGPSTDG